MRLATGAVKCTSLLYADDSVLLVSGRDPSVIQHTLVKDLDYLPLLFATLQNWLVDKKNHLFIRRKTVHTIGYQAQITERKQDHDNVCGKQDHENVSWGDYGSGSLW